MRYSRQDKILELIDKYEIETQEMLANLLKENGYNVTQATVSRDIKELQLVKTLSSGGRSKYAAPYAGTAVNPAADRFVKIFKNTLVNVTSSGNIIVLKTLTGCASAAAEAVDSLDLSSIVGSIAGDNTIFVLVDNEANVPELLKKFKGLIGAR